MKAANDVCRSPLTGVGAMQNADDRSTSIANSARRAAVPLGLARPTLLTSRYFPCVRNELDRPIGAIDGIAIAPILV